MTVNRSRTIGRTAALVVLAMTLPLQAAAQALQPVAIDRFVEAYARSNRVPGVAVVVTRGAEVVHVAAYGRDSSGSLLTIDSPFPIASLSKSFTALAVMQLVDQGRVSLDAPVTRYLPEFRMADPRAARITVRQLLDHTSGMSDRAFPEKSLRQPHTLEAAVRRLATARLESAPGAESHYHNPNYAVAARMVEVVSGEPFAVYMKRRVFEPTGMDDTFTVGDLRENSGVTDGHLRLFGLPVPAEEPYWFLDGGSGVVSTPRDMAQWLMLQSNGGVTAGGVRLVSRAAVDQMQATAAKGDAAGLGWNVDVGDDGPRRVSHGGWMFTYTASQALLPDQGYGIAAMANTGLGLAADDADVLVHGLVDMASGKTVEAGLPLGLIGGAVLGGLILATLALGLRGLSQAKSWARRRRLAPAWRIGLTLAPALAPLILLVSLRHVLSWLFGGRDGSWIQVGYVAGPLVIWLVLGSLFGLAITAARLRALRSARAVGLGA